MKDPTLVVAVTGLSLIRIDTYTYLVELVIGPWCNDSGSMVCTIVSECMGTLYNFVTTIGVRERQSHCRVIGLQL